MAAIAAADIVSITDKLAALYLKALGTSGNDEGLGDSSAAWGAAQSASELDALIAGLDDTSQQRYLAGPSADLLLGIPATKVLAGKLLTFFNGLEQTANATGLGSGSTAVTTLDKFATYYNTGSGGAWNCLFAPDFLTVYAAVKGVNPSASNTYFEVLQGSTYTNACGKFVASGAGTGTFTDGQAISSTTYAGGFGQVNVASITGSGVITVAATWRKTDGTTASGNGTATISGTGVTVLTPPFSNALLLDVTNITTAAGLTAGTYYVEAKRPSGRTNPPT